MHDLQFGSRVYAHRILSRLGNARTENWPIDSFNLCENDTSVDGLQPCAQLVSGFVRIVNIFLGRLCLRIFCTLSSGILKKCA
jgi:hypothetical protein